MEMEEGVNIKQIILRFLEGTASEHDVEILQQWLEKKPENRQYFEELNNTFQTSVTKNRVTHDKVEHAWSRLLQQTMEPVAPSVRRLQFSRPLAFKIAAAIAFVIVSSALIFLLTRIDRTPLHETIVRNSITNNTKIQLPDSSTVWLNANSTLEYTSEFGKISREVTLKGEAFFDVKKDSKEFIVRTDKVHVHVKGTKFNVESDAKNATIKTTLSEGKVELRLDGSNQHFTLKPGDQVILNTVSNAVVLKQVNPADFSAWKEEKLVFDNVPLSEVISKLENRYKVNITVASAQAKGELFTMTVENESIEEVLNMIKLSSKLQIKKKDNEIILYE